MFFKSIFSCYIYRLYPHNLYKPTRLPYPQKNLKYKDIYRHHSINLSFLYHYGRFNYTVSNVDAKQRKLSEAKAIPYGSGASEDVHAVLCFLFPSKAPINCNDRYYKRIPSSVTVFTPYNRKMHSSFNIRSG
jgi:hypothetical protein